MKYLGIEIDLSRDALLPEQGLAMLTRKGFYKKDHEYSPQQTFARAATCYCFGDYAFAQRMYDYMSLHWMVNASPPQSNAVDIEWPPFYEEEFEEAGDWLEKNVTPDGMPISCFLNYVDDSKEGLASTMVETSWLSMMGGGVGTYFANRSVDEKSTGVLAHSAIYDAMTLAYKQKETRKGSIAAYLPIDHPEIVQFIEMRNPVGGDQNKKCFNLNNAVTIPDSFMHAMIAGEDYELVDPKHGPTGRFLNARKVWERLCEMRFETGEPYLIYIDNVNRGKPSWITNPLYTVLSSNLCTEIMQMINKDRTAVCCLSSLNMEKYDEWKDSNIVADMVRYLDNILEYFIRLAPPQLKKAIFAAKQERSIGIGNCGWHSYLQSKMIPWVGGGFGSAIQHIHMIGKNIRNKAIAESKRLGELRGEAPDCVGTGMRNAHLFAVAPNASSSSIIGVSPSVEPWKSNAFTATGRAGTFIVKNKHFAKVLDKHGMNTDEVWKWIATEADGSVQGLDFLTDEEKAVFLTAKEIPLRWQVEHAITRQPHICQGQSTNIFVSPDTTADELSDVQVYAWLNGAKSLYYCRNEAASRAKIGTGGDMPLGSIAVQKKVEYTSCLGCEG